MRKIVASYKLTIVATILPHIFEGLRSVLGAEHLLEFDTGFLPTNQQKRHPLEWRFCWVLGVCGNRYRGTRGRGGVSASIACCHRSGFALTSAKAGRSPPHTKYMPPHGRYVFA